MKINPGACVSGALFLAVGSALACGEPATSPRDSSDVEPRFHHRGGHGGGGSGGEEDSLWVLLNDDASQYRVRSDNLGALDVDLDGAVDPNGYSNDEACVTVADNGFRTVSATPACNSQSNFRFLTFDQSLIAAADRFDFDQDGTTEAIEEAPARFSTFEKGPAATCGNDRGTEVCVVVLVLTVLRDAAGNPTGTSSDDAWGLTFQQPVAIGQNSGGIPVLTLAAGQAAADVCFSADRPSGNKPCPSSGVIDLPFHVTWKGYKGGI